MNRDSRTYRRLQSRIKTSLKKSSGVWQEIFEHSQEIELDRAETLVDHLELNKCVYIVINGAFECILKTNGTTDNLVWFFFDSCFDIIPNMDSYYKNHAAKYKIVALEPSTVIKFEMEKIEHWQGSFQAFEGFLKNEIIEWFFHYFEIRNNFLALSPIDFLGYLETNYPDIPNRISSQKLASFMGLTPEWLSKLKKRKQSKSMA